MTDGAPTSDERARIALDVHRLGNDQLEIERQESSTRGAREFAPFTAWMAPPRRLGACRLASSPHHGRCLIRTDVRRPIRPPVLYFAAASFYSICSNFASDLGGAKEIRTPDLLHAIWRQHVHPRPSPQVTVLTRPCAATSVHLRCGTFLLYRSHPCRGAPVVPHMLA